MFSNKQVSRVLTLVKCLNLDFLKKCSQYILNFVYVCCRKLPILLEFEGLNSRYFFTLSVPCQIKCCVIFVSSLLPVSFISIKLDSSTLILVYYFNIIKKDPQITYICYAICGAFFIGAKWRSANWLGAKWRSAKWLGAKWRSAKWLGANWRSAKIQGSLLNTF